MALSDSFYTNVNDHWRLQLEWSATQNVVANTSYVTAKLYWIARDGYGAVNSTASKTCAIQMNDGAFDTNSAAGMAALNGNQKKLIHTYSKTIQHNTDGTGSFSIDAYFDAEVNLSGTQYNRIDMDQKSFTLNTIPRASTLSSGDSWTAGSNSTISVKRSSSSFRHEVEIYIKNASGVWDWIKKVDLSTSETSKSTGFTIDENRQIFVAVGQRGTAETRMTLQTFKGSDTDPIGSQENYGTLTIPAASTTDWGGDFNIGETMSGTIKQNNSNFTHTIQVIFGGTTYTLHSQTEASTWSYDTDAIASALYAKIPDAKSITGEIRIYTYYEGVLVRTYNKSSITAYVVNSDPEFGTGYTYKDSNPDSFAITGNDQYLIQGVSTTLFELPITANATPKNGASIKSYVVTLNGVTKTLNYSSTLTISVDLGVMQARNNVALTVKAIDSRGFSTTTSKTVTVLPYVQPVVTAAAKRLNNFEAATTLTMSGSISLLDISGVARNDILSMQYRYKEASVTTWGEWTDFVYTEDGAAYTAEDVVLTLNSAESFNIEIQTTDKLTTTPASLTVAVGQPIFFIDSKKKSLGFNDVPINDNEFRFNGKLVFGANRWASAGGGIDMGNGDILGANAIFFNDTSENSLGEGLLFLKSGKIAGSIVTTDYDKFHLFDGSGYINGKPVFTSDSSIIWNGVAMFLQEEQVAAPTKKLSECPNGWVLIWSDAGGTYDWAFSYIPKDFPSINSTGTGARFPIPAAFDYVTTKYIYISDVAVSGNAENNDAGPNGAVLRYIFSY